VNKGYLHNWNNSSNHFCLIYSMMFDKTARLFAHVSFLLYCIMHGYWYCIIVTWWGESGYW